ncbi:MAG: molybdenum cofactor biosynthesis protein B [Gammaproteobacteria bacterium]|jgi:molybdenum cofactor biosynthesis protein B|uniref:Molybdenum cofactor biosynthesis protein B n=1 Tax=Marinomonas polaris DSM 16579 TaxID=1122206 RepID=A0A1M5C7Y0_9GAMM|nr:MULTISPECIES: molybdenum cofactor biosynthesis protein B [Marinomonas]MBU1295682.1 molybdenum cofactor biosynthesis protein B [Gammaproteobacteria bacterium]MBU1465127.1 molybdenum cofactor biosynthesis protein B [Gammaproteobacteria bacterium]MBU2025075.1 molybdenum cofactor biosynthesis protein B [Gammaproteobacteria bacterium]MBU2238389.1 molybdenum cofactor biosynthesis protein B [Gammaproteobacteria bacterium]MBU2320154.1 molybdenum cofactor biosynthesis protein B [Gammaproteobacteria 
MAKTPTPFRPLNINVLTVSDTRSIAEDTSGDALIELLSKAGHTLNERKLVKDDVYQMRAVVSNWIADKETHVVLITGGTGFYSRDSTPEAMTPLFDKTIEGFGELFRQISYTEIGTSTIQSRAIAGLANQTLVFCLPGSTGACKTAWNGILEEQLNASHRPCNFVSMLIGPNATNQHEA